MATVPIVTEVTKAQLDALVAANALNEGLQYKVIDKGWLLIAISNNKYRFASIPYLTYAAFLTCDPVTDIPSAIVVQNEIGAITWDIYNGTPGSYVATLNGAFGSQKTAIIIGSTFNYNTPDIVILKTSCTNDAIFLSTIDSGGTVISGELLDTYIEIRVYLI